MDTGSTLINGSMSEPRDLPRDNDNIERDYPATRANTISLPVKKLDQRKPITIGLRRQSAISRSQNANNKFKPEYSKVIENSNWAKYWNISDEFLLDQKLPINVINKQTIIFDFIGDEKLQYDKINELIEFYKNGNIISTDKSYIVNSKRIFETLIELNKYNEEVLINPLLEIRQKNKIVNHDKINDIVIYGIKAITHLYLNYSLSYPFLLNELKLTKSFMDWINEKYELKSLKEKRNGINIIEYNFLSLLKSTISLEKLIVFFEKLLNFEIDNDYQTKKKLENALVMIKELSDNIERHIILGKVNTRIDWTFTSNPDYYSNNSYMAKKYKHISNLNNWSNHWNISEEEFSKIPKNVRKLQFSIFELITVEQERFERNQIFIDWYGKSFKTIKPSLIAHNRNNDDNLQLDFWKSTFGNWIPVMNIHKKLVLDPLLKMLEEEGKFLNINRVIDILFNWITNKDTESSYLKFSFNYSKLVDLLKLNSENDNEKNSRFNKWVEEMDSLFHKNISFDTLLLTLVNGFLVKYPLIIKELIKSTEVHTDSDHHSTEYTQLKSISNKVEILVKKFQECTHIGGIINRISNKQQLKFNNNKFELKLNEVDNFFKPYRVLIKEGEIIYKNYNNWLLNNKKYRLFLFDNCLLICEITETKPFEIYKLIAAVS